MNRYKHIGGYEYIGAETGLRERGSQGNIFFSIIFKIFSIIVFDTHDIYRR